MKLSCNCIAQWWGDSVILFDSYENYYVISTSEVLLLEAMQNNKSIETITCDFASKTKMKVNQAAKILDCFLKAYPTCFSYTETGSNDAMIIHGVKGKYYPAEIHISLTNVCPLHCKHCYKKAGDSNAFYLNSDKLISFLDLFNGKTPAITLSGGEPFLHPSFVDIFTKLASDYNISVLTSGFIPLERYVNILKAARRGVGFSLYSLKQEKNDAFTGVIGSYSMLMHNIDLLSKKAIPISVTVFDELLTENEKEEILKWADNYKIKSIQHGKIAYVGRAITEYFAEEKPVFSRKRKIIQSSAQRKVTQPFHCLAGSLFWSIYENGEIHPCGMCTEDELKMGSIEEFDVHIFEDRRKYLSDIKKTKIIKESKNRKCPFNCEE